MREAGAQDWCTITVHGIQRLRGDGALIMQLQQLSIACATDFNKLSWRPNTNTSISHASAPAASSLLPTRAEAMSTQTDAVTPPAASDIPTTPLQVQQDAEHAASQLQTCSHSEPESALPREVMAILTDIIAAPERSRRATVCRAPGALREPPLRGPRRSSVAQEPAADPSESALLLATPSGALTAPRCAAFKRVTLVKTHSAPNRRGQGSRKPVLTEYQKRQTPRPNGRLCKVNAGCARHCNVQHGCAFPRYRQTVQS